jgi:restriction system protein
MARQREKGERARRRAREATACLLGLGTLLLLGPLFMSKGTAHQVFTGFRPMALLMLVTGVALLWWQRRQSASASVQAPRRTSAPDSRNAGNDGLGATTKQAPALETRAVQHEPPAEWSKAVFDTVEWRRFEAIVEALFRQAGFITKAQPHGHDGGVDVWLYSKHQVDGAPVSLVQCKHWQDKRVGVDKIRELRGVMAAHDVKRGQFATTSGFTADAEQFAKDNGINLLDVSSLLTLIDQRTPEQQTELLQVALEGEYWKPTCASCGIKMVERNRRADGTPFWGCANYPRCKASLTMRMPGP